MALGMTIALSAILAILVGALIILFPKILNVAVGLYLMIAGLLTLLSGL